MESALFCAVGRVVLIFIFVVVIIVFVVVVEFVIEFFIVELVELFVVVIEVFIVEVVVVEIVVVEIIVVVIVIVFFVVVLLFFDFIFRTDETVFLPVPKAADGKLGIDLVTNIYQQLQFFTDHWRTLKNGDTRFRSTPSLVLDESFRYVTEGLAIAGRIVHNRPCHGWLRNGRPAR
jgi:hypothetical protein